MNNNSSYINAQFFAFENDPEGTIYRVFQKEINTWEGQYIKLPEYETIINEKSLQEWIRDCMPDGMECYKSMIHQPDRYIFKANRDLHIEIRMNAPFIHDVMIMNLCSPLCLDYDFFEAFFALSDNAKRNIFCYVIKWGGAKLGVRLTELEEWFRHGKTGDVSQTIISETEPDDPRSFALPA